MNRQKIAQELVGLAKELTAAKYKKEQIGYVTGIKYHGSEQLMDTRGGIMVGYGKKTKIFKTERRAWSAMKKSEHADDPTAFVRPYFQEVAVAKDLTASKAERYWDNQFDLLDTALPKYDADKVRDWNKVDRHYRSTGMSSTPASIIAHWFHEYKSGRASRDGAIRNLAKEMKKYEKVMSREGSVAVAKELTAADAHYELYQALKELGKKITDYREHMRKQGLDREADSFYLDMSGLLRDMNKRFKKL